MPRLMDQIPRGSLPGDEYGGEGHQMVNPRFSKRTNMNITNQHTTDGNIGGLEGQYGKPGVEPDPYGDAQNGLGMLDRAQYGMQSRSFDQVSAEMRELFGEESAAQILDEVLRIAAFQDTGGQMQMPKHMQDGTFGGGSLPRPDFGNQQPYTTGPTGDGDMVALEQHYGYPVSANNRTGNPMAPVRNMPKRNAFSK